MLLIQLLEKNCMYLLYIFGFLALENPVLSPTYRRFWGFQKPELAIKYLKFCKNLHIINISVSIVLCII
jgi:hypothetical protein